MSQVFPALPMLCVGKMQKNAAERFNGIKKGTRKDELYRIQTRHSFFPFFFAFVLFLVLYIRPLSDTLDPEQEDIKMQNRQGDYLSAIDRAYPVRNSGEQKQAFRAYALEEAKRLGFSHAAVENNQEHQNLVFGDPQTAGVIFTAHYDTPRRSLLPNLMLVTNRFLYWAYQIGTALIILPPAIGAAIGVAKILHLDWNTLPARLLMVGVYLAVFYALFFLVLRGPANRRNRNDNTSGTACVMELMRRTGETERAAFILFDNEEKGKKGSKAFAKASPYIRENTLVINLDCVGNGDTFVFSPSVEAENDPLYGQMQSAAREAGLNARFFSAGKAQMNSDHKSFVRGVGVCACLYRPRIGYYTGRIHTVRDTVAEPGNIQQLSDALERFIKG